MENYQTIKSKIIKLHELVLRGEHEEAKIEKKDMTISYFTQTDKENVIVEEHNIIGRAI